MIETDAKADRACPRESLPWSILPCWDRYENQRLEPQPSAHVAELTCRLFRHAANESWKDETIYLLDLLPERLLEVEYAPIKGILHMIEKFLEGLGEFIETVRREVPDQMVLLSLHQLATLIKTRWRLVQRTHLVHSRVELRMKEVALPNELLDLMRTLNSDPSTPRSLSAESENHFFCESSETLLSTVSTAPGWTVAFGLLNRSLWLVHETRGQYDKNGQSDSYRVKAPEPLQDISFPSSIPGATWFIIKIFRARYSLDGLTDFLQA
ncbi:hypothetical protein F4806DRAFT_346136 [Annulohypoxylon nitens]|nr:hypothetical protein F4806DRAFT_346136 [Annulohypoxylon nitens]